MPAPEDLELHGVKRICGMIQHMSKFLPNIADELEPIRALTRKDTPFVWSMPHEKAFQRVKDKLTKEPILEYCNPERN